MIKKRSKRLIISVIMALYFMVITVLCIYKFAEVIGTAAISGIITIITVYILGETKRPSS